MAMPWLKVDTSGWLKGSIRKQLTPAQRGVWMDILAMAGDCRLRDGTLRHAEGIPMDRDYIAGVLRIPIELLNETINACQKDKNRADSKSRIAIWDDGTIQISNWERYQSTPLGKEAKKPLDAMERDKLGKFDAYRKGKEFPEEAMQGILARGKGKIPTPSPKPGEKTPEPKPIPEYNTTDDNRDFMEGVEMAANTLRGREATEANEIKEEK